MPCLDSKVVWVDCFAIKFGTFCNSKKKKTILTNSIQFVCLAVLGIVNCPILNSNIKKCKFSKSQTILENLKEF